ncbi:MAG: glycosyltransferase family 2 protein, partial [Selenomonadaceae bacterium]|nr:glycosyltransferase family 2 protein [Selenomonadaceae bacterium]
MNCEEPPIWFAQDKWVIDEDSRNNFLNEYSKDLFPLVTVIIPTFNRPKYFKLALESALNQTYRNIEVVVSDNSTEDDTENLMQDYIKNDSRIKYFRHKNFTANDNWNFC